MTPRFSMEPVRQNVQEGFLHNIPSEAWVRGSKISFPEFDGSKDPNSWFRRAEKFDVLQQHQEISSWAQLEDTMNLQLGQSDYQEYTTRFSILTTRVSHDRTRSPALVPQMSQAIAENEAPVSANTKKRITLLEGEEDFLTSWKSIKVAEDGDFDYGTPSSKKKGFKFDKLDFNFNGPGGFDGASENLKEGDVAFSVPNSLVVTLDRVLGNETIVDLLTTNKLSELACLTLYLMYEKKQGKKSVWYPFIRELDRQRGRGQLAVQSPLLWSHEELAYLTGSPTKAEVDERDEGIKREYNELDTVGFMAGSLFQQYPYDIPTEAFSFEIFKQAFVAVQSCVVHLQKVPLARRFALVPMGPPLLAYRSNCKAMMTAREGAVELVVDRPYKCGEPIVIGQALTERDERITLASVERRDSSTSRRHNLASLIKVKIGSEEKNSGMVFIGSEKENDENRRVTSSGKRVEETLCKVLSSGQVNEEESFVSDKKNMTPTLVARSKSKLKENLKLELPPSKHLDFNDSPLSSSDYFPSDKENMTPSVSHSHKATRLGDKQNQMILDKDKCTKYERISFQSLIVNSKSESRVSSIVNVAGKSTDFNSCTQSRIDKHGDDNCSVDQAYATTGEYWKKLNRVVDASCLLDEESRKSLKLLEGIKGTHLIIPRMVIRELDCLKRKAIWFRKDEDASSSLQQIEHCMVKTSWWIHVQSSSESVSIAPTPPASPRSWLSDGSRANKPIPFSKCCDFIEIVSPTVGDHILECALLFKELKNDEQIVLLTTAITLTIKAMAEGLIGETAKDCRESLVNQFSKRFLWADSSLRGPS